MLTSRLATCGEHSAHMTGMRMRKSFKSVNSSVDQLAYSTHQKWTSETTFHVKGTALTLSHIRTLLQTVCFVAHVRSGEVLLDQEVHGQVEEFVIGTVLLSS